MVRSVTVDLILTAVACICCTAPGQSRPQWMGRDAPYSVQVYDGIVSLGHVQGGNYGPGSFTINHGGNAYGTGNGGHSNNIENIYKNIGNYNNFGNNNYNGKNNRYGRSNRDLGFITNLRHSGNPGPILYLHSVPAAHYQP